MKLNISAIASHRNGICGAPFHVIIFTDTGPESSVKVAIVFDKPDHCAVLDVAKLAAGDIAFGSNSWRCDQFEPFLRHAIKTTNPQGDCPMPRTYPLQITLEDLAEETVDQIACEIEEAVENIRKYHGGAVTHTEDVDIDELLAEHGAAAVIWTAGDIRKIVPHLDDAQVLAVIDDCFRIFNPDETENREMIFQAAERLFPTLSREQRCQRADKAINAYANGDTRENLVDLLADAMHWCDDMDEPFEEFCATARVHHDAERNPNAKE